VKLLQVSAFDTFLALSYLEESNITEMEALCIEGFEELNIKHINFFAYYYKAKEGFKTLPLVADGLLMLGLLSTLLQKH
jgi:hypothetical protein